MSEPLLAAPKSTAALRELLERAQSGLAAFVSTDLAVLRVAGSDRARWLHAQCTQDVKQLAAGAAVNACVLDARGRNLGPIVVGAAAETFDVVLPAAEAEPLLAHWRRFIIAEDVRVDGVDADLRLLTGLGAVPWELFSDWPPIDRPKAARVTVADRPVTVINDPACTTPVWIVVLPREDDVAAAFDARIAARGGERMHASVFDALRVRMGRPRWGVDVDATFLPKECGDEASTTSYTKGCYTGQEVVAKLHFLGQPRRMLRRVSWKGGPVAPGAPLRDGSGQPVGKITSSAPATEPGRWVGLAVAEGPKRLEAGLTASTMDIDDEPVDVAFAAPTVLAP